MKNRDLDWYLKALDKRSDSDLRDFFCAQAVDIDLLLQGPCNDQIDDGKSLAIH